MIDEFVKRVAQRTTELIQVYNPSCRAYVKTTSDGHFVIYAGGSINYLPVPPLQYTIPPRKLTELPPPLSLANVQHFDVRVFQEFSKYYDGGEDAAQVEHYAQIIRLQLQQQIDHKMQEIFGAGR